jgi:hypothetical protein
MSEADGKSKQFWAFRFDRDMRLAGVGCTVKAPLLG